MGWGCGGKGKKGGKGHVDEWGYGAAPKAPAMVSTGDDDEELIWNAVTEAVQPILRLERELDQNKLEKRLRDCFKKGAKGMSFTGKPWYDLINEYADVVFAAVFNSLGEKEWLPQCDFLLCLDAGVKDSFPKNVLARVPQLEFEKVVLSAHDRAHEEQRVQPLMWEIVANFIDGPKGKKKVYNACEEAWKVAFQDPSDVQSFVATWIDSSIALIAGVSQGEPQWTMEPPIGCQLFDAMLQGGAIPFALVEAHGPPPPGWPFIGYCIEQAYATHVVTQDGSVYGKGGGKKGGGKGKKGKDGKARPLNPLLADVPPGQCRDFLLSSCKRGDECKFGHDDGVKAEVDLKRALQEGEEESEQEAKKARLE